jgi:hypothetical protein
MVTCPVVVRLVAMEVLPLRHGYYPNESATNSHYVVGNFN